MKYATGGSMAAGLTGAGLERAVKGIARSRPNLVALPGVTVRRMQAHPPGAQP